MNKLKIKFLWYPVLIAFFSIPVYIENTLLPWQVNAVWSGLAYSLFGLAMYSNVSLTIVKVLVPVYVALLLLPVPLLAINEKFRRSVPFVAGSAIFLIILIVYGFHIYSQAYGI